MFKFVDLSLQLKDSITIRDGLHQYKNICQQSFVFSLEKVVRHYIRTAEERVKLARSQHMEGKVILDVEDLEEVETPESVLLAAVQDASAGTSDRESLTPWLKYLWDAYRTILDIVRNNSKLERLYQDAAMSSFEFCVAFDRKKEFRNLCDTLRKHYKQIGQYTNQVNPINFSNPESLHYHINVRLLQIKAAARMELWQEAFKGAEDISTLMNLSKKRPRPQLLAEYYEQLAIV
jgi:translation initiation factor 3 subunit A